MWCASNFPTATCGWTPVRHHQGRKPTIEARRTSYRHSSQAAKIFMGKWDSPLSWLGFKNLILYFSQGFIFFNRVDKLALAIFLGHVWFWPPITYIFLYYYWIQFDDMFHFFFKSMHVCTPTFSLKLSFSWNLLSLFLQTKYTKWNSFKFKFANLIQTWTWSWGCHDCKQIGKFLDYRLFSIFY